MKYNNPKNKINFQTHENIWNDLIFLKLKKKKWRFRLKYSSLIKLKKDPRPKSLKHLYKKRLLTRQKFKNFYGLLSDHKLKKDYKTLKKKKNYNTMDNLSIHLEKRLDTIIYRSNIVSSIFEAKQLISHKKVKVNNKIVSNSGFILTEGDFIQILDNISKFDNSKTILPAYLEINSKLNIILLLRQPKIKEILYPFKYNKNFVFEYLNNK